MTVRDVAGRVFTALERRRPWRVFDRPIFLIAPPRSGSTFLHDLLAAHPGLVSWPMEAQRAFVDAAPAGHPIELGQRWPPDYATDELRRDLSRALYLGRLDARRRQHQPVGRLEPFALRRVRLLEKTPANVLRVETLTALYPDAKLVFLHRDAPASIASLLEAWETPTAAHAGVVHAGRTLHWMMLTPPGWLDHVDDPLPTRAAFQWRAGVEYPLDAGDRISADRWLRLSYEDLLAEPERQLRRILDFAELSAHPAVLAGVERVGQAGRTSLSSPHPDKWQSRAADIEPLLPELEPVRRRLGYL